MKIIKKSIIFITSFIIAIGLFLCTGCTNNDNGSNVEIKDIKESDVMTSTIKVTIGEKNYELKLEENETVREFIKLLPQEYIMKDLNKNEKYVYLNESLPTNKYYPKHIQKGDVMLYEDNCIVIFYKSFDTNYSYTKIGNIIDLDDLTEDNVAVIFEK